MKQDTPKLQASEVVSPAGEETPISEHPGKPTQPPIQPPQEQTEPPPQPPLKPSKKKYDFEMVYGFGTLVVGVISGILYYLSWKLDKMALRLDKNLREPETIVINATKALENSTVKIDKMVLHFLERKNVFNSLEPTYMGYSSTAVVYGPRGSGKSTAVMHVFSNRKCVVTSTLPTDGESNTCVKDWASSVLDSLGIQNIPSGVDPLKILKESLVQFKAKGQKTSLKDLPIIIVEVDSRCEGQFLENLLLQTKHLGADKELANFVVVLSASRAAYNVNIGLDQLRAHAVLVDELSDDEAKEYLRSCLMKTIKNLSDEEVEEVVNDALCKVGNLLLHLVPLCEDWLKCPGDKESLMNVSSLKSGKILRIAKGCLLVFLDKLNEERNIHRRELREEFLNLCMNKRDVSDFAKAIGLNMNTLVRLNSSVTPEHPFFVDLSSGLISVSSPHMKKAIKAELN